MSAEQNESPTAILYSGPNFSGRTARLRERLGALRSRGPTCLVPPETDEAISGLAPTVACELALGRRRLVHDTSELAQALSFSCDSNQNPLTLSGGEKVLLVLLAAHARGCLTVGIDVALEQLDVERRRRFVDSIPRWLRSRTSLLIADNRSGELQPSGTLTVRMETAGGQSNGSRCAVAASLPPMPAPTLEPAEIVLDDLWFGYSRARPILQGASAVLRPGNVYHLEGANGAGKSTLAKVLIGRLRPWEGSIRYCAAAVEPWRHPGRFVAYHFQDPDVQLFTTQVTSEIRPPRRCSSESSDSVARTLADTFGLGECRDQHPFDLPYVLRKRLALAAVIATNSPWLIIDEPTLGQDDETAMRLATLFKELAARGRGVIVISHSPSFVSQLNAVPLLLSGGRFISS